MLDPPPTADPGPIGEGPSALIQPTSDVLGLSPGGDGSAPAGEEQWDTGLAIDEDDEGELDYSSSVILPPLSDDDEEEERRFSRVSSERFVERTDRSAAEEAAETETVRNLLAYLESSARAPGATATEGGDTSEPVNLGYAANTRLACSYFSEHGLSDPMVLGEEPLDPVCSSTKAQYDQKQDPQRPAIPFSPFV